MTGWHIRAVCKCGWHCELPFGEYVHMFNELCPDCGADVPRHLWSKENDWSKKKMRWVKNPATVRWWNIFSWFDGMWQVMDKDGKVTNFRKE